MEEKNCGQCCCHEQCSSCHEIEENACPVCGNVGLQVPYETVCHLANVSIREQLIAQEYRLCTHRACKVAYYANEDKVMLREITVPIWFKHDKNEYIVCYCRRITLDDIKEAVGHNEITKEGIIRYLNKDDVITDCKHNNPTGICCDRLFDNAIEYVKKHQG